MRHPTRAPLARAARLGFRAPLPPPADGEAAVPGRGDGIATSVARSYASSAPPPEGSELPASPRQGVGAAPPLRGARGVVPSSSSVNSADAGSGAPPARRTPPSATAGDEPAAATRCTECACAEGGAASCTRRGAAVAAAPRAACCTGGRRVPWRRTPSATPQLLPDDDTTAACTGVSPAKAIASAVAPEPLRATGA